MADKTDPSGKVSPALAATLARLPDRAVVRVLLLLDGDEAGRLARDRVAARLRDSLECA